MKNTSNSVPRNSARYAAGPRSCTLRPPEVANSFPLGFDAVRRILLVLAACISFAGCGDDGRERATLALDFQPNAVHAGIYAALREDLDARAGEVRRPRDLEGRRVGVTGLPSDDAVLRAVVEDDGGDFERVERVTIGFSAVPSLIAGGVDAVVSFWNAEGVAL